MAWPWLGALGVGEPVRQGLSTEIGAAGLFERRDRVAQIRGASRRAIQSGRLFVPQGGLRRGFEQVLGGDQYRHQHRRIRQPTRGPSAVSNRAKRCRAQGLAQRKPGREQPHRVVPEQFLQRPQPAALRAGAEPAGQAVRVAYRAGFVRRGLPEIHPAARDATGHRADACHGRQLGVVDSRVRPLGDQLPGAPGTGAGGVRPRLAEPSGRQPGQGVSVVHQLRGALPDQSTRAGGAEVDRRPPVPVRQICRGRAGVSPAV